MNVTILLDGSNLVWRTWYVAESVNSGAMDGLLHVHMFLNAVKNYMNMYKANKIICCWDKRKDKQKNYRNTLYPEYKQNRDKDKAKQVHCETELIEELLGYLGVINFYPARLEADDCIAYFCDTLPGRKIIVSSDKDLLQLINEDVVFYDPIRKVEINNSNFDVYSKLQQDTFLIEKCFLGDSSDNVKGIKGFGPVKIKRYLNNEVTLTEEQENQFKLNMELFDLSLYKTLNDEIEYYKSQSLESVSNWSKFLEVCEARGLNSIVKGQESFYSTFCMESTLSNMFENIFG